MKYPLTIHFLACIALFSSSVSHAEQLRARDLNIKPGVLPTGKLNAITDVAGVKVGHVTLHQGKAQHTGVTAIIPAGGNLRQSKVPAAVFVGNG